MALKQAIIIRSDLKLGKGKAASQVAHASLSSYKKADKDIAKEWEKTGGKKVVLKVGSEKELLELFERMKQEIPCALIRDAGHTQIEPGTITCFGAGPADEELIDKYAKGLRLL